MADIRKEELGGQLTVVVSGDATVANAKELKGVLLDAIRSAPTVRVVLESLASVDVTLLQLLCSAHRSAAMMKKSMTVDGGDREPLATLLRQSGFLRHIGCHDSAHGPCLWIEAQSGQESGGP